MREIVVQMAARGAGLDTAGKVAAEPRLGGDVDPAWPNRPQALEHALKGVAPGGGRELPDLAIGRVDIGEVLGLFAGVVGEVATYKVDRRGHRRASHVSAAADCVTQPAAFIGGGELP